MKLITQLLLPCSLFAVSSLLAQTSNDRTKIDSSFTLTKRLQQDKLDIGQHGVFFREKTKQVLNDFKTIQTLSLADLSKYQQQIIKQDEHILKIWTAKNASEIVTTIIEINSVYPIDTTNDGSRLKDTIIYNDYFLILKDTKKKYSLSNYQQTRRK